MTAEPSTKSQFTEAVPRLVFMGTSDLACHSLRALADKKVWKIVAVFTQPDRPGGRKLRLRPSPVKLEAQRLGLRVHQPNRIRESLSLLEGLSPCLIVVAAYGQILPVSVLKLPRFGCLNVHASLLPKYRGAGPIQWAILNGETETGVTIMKMDEGLDTGEMLSKMSTPINEEDDAQSLHDRLAGLGAQLLVRTIPEYLAGNIQPVPQNESKATHAPKIMRETGRLNWTRSAVELRNQVRALVPWPGAFTHLKEDSGPRFLKLWRAEVEQGIKASPGKVVAAGNNGIVMACGLGGLRVTELQAEGRRRMIAREFLAGHPIPSGACMV